MFLRILLAVARPELSDRLRACLPTEDVLVETASDPGAFWSRLGEEPCDLVIADASSVKEPLVESLAALRSLPEQTELIAVVAAEDAEQRARIQAAGALAVVNEHLPESALRRVLGGIVERQRRSAAQRIRAEAGPGTPLLSDFSSASPAMKRVLKLADKVATSDSSLLILGETGTGKEWLARGIHASSRRAPCPFVALNCAAVPDTLLESELFGHQRGSFTGAHRSRRGYFELAHRGTLFLDEIGEMPPPLQSKLLRVLQDRQVRRVGGEEAFEVDVRIMAATNRNPEAAIESGELRRDLYYRLAVVALELPPLRDRREDVLPLFESHLEQSRVRLARWEVTEVSAAARAALVEYEWPGNVRELINVAERAVLLCEGEEIGIEDLPPEIGGALTEDGSGAPAAGAGGWVSDHHLSLSLEEARSTVIAEFERAYLRRTLEETRGSVGRTAERAGIDPRTLYNKMKAYGLRKEDFRGAKD